MVQRFTGSPPPQVFPGPTEFPVGNNNFNQNFLNELLGEVPEAAFFSAPNIFPGRTGGQPRSPRQRRTFQQAFGQIQNQFLGRLGEQIRGGQLPTLQFQDFLRDFNPQQFLFENQPRASQTQFNPRTTSLFPF